jgi:hypothetical protein
MQAIPEIRDENNKVCLIFTLFIVITLAIVTLCEPSVPCGPPTPVPSPPSSPSPWIGIFAQRVYLGWTDRPSPHPAPTHRESQPPGRYGSCLLARPALYSTGPTGRRHQTYTHKCKLPHCLGWPDGGEGGQERGREAGGREGWELAKFVGPGWDRGEGEGKGKGISRVSRLGGVTLVLCMCLRAVWQL